MTENTNAGNGDNNQNNNASGNADAQNANAGAADAQKNTDAANAPFDPAKISDADFEKIFSDERLFKHSRFSELNDLAKAGKAAKDAETKRLQDEAVKKGDFEKVLGEKETKITELSQTVQKMAVNNALTIAASKLNAVDPDAILALVDRSKIAVDDSGKVTGVDDALKALTESKAYLFGKSNTQTTRLGTGANPGSNNTGDLKRFKHSELQNAEFYKANEKDILASMKAGLIENDL
jgi:hypothetical protein